MLDVEKKPFFSPDSLFRHPEAPMELVIPEEEAQVVLDADWTIVAKIASRCNMNCEYEKSTDKTNKSGKSCYMYTDDSYKQEERFMEPEVAQLLANRMAEQARKFPNWRANLVLHGGEPLLLGKERLITLLDIFTKAVPDVIRPDGTREKVVNIRLQTNLTLLTQELMDEVFVPYGVQVSASLDGTREGNKRRRMRDGNESYDKAMLGLNVLTRYPKNFPIILGVLSLENDPIETDQELAHFNKNRDYNLPHATWDEPPPEKDPSNWNTQYADWLIKVFDAHYNKDPDNPGHTGVRLIDSIIDRLNGKQEGAILVETLPGLSPVREFTVGVSGEVGGLDSLVAISRDVFTTSMNLSSHTIEDVVRHPTIMSRARNSPAELLKQLGTECQRCTMVQICGGGLIHDRHSEENSYKNPSVYCADIQELITHISRVLLLDKQKARYTSYRTCENKLHMSSQPAGTPSQGQSEPELTPGYSGDFSLWPAYIEYAFPSLTSFERLAKLLAEVNIDTYDRFFPEENLSEYVNQSWLTAKTQSFREKAYGSKESWSYDLELPAETVHQAGGQQSSGLWVARIGKEVVGVSSIKLMNLQEAVIGNLHIQRSHQRKLIGQMLLAQAISAAGDRDIVVQVHEESAGDFYRKRGFTGTEQTEEVLLFDALPLPLRTLRLRAAQRKDVIKKIRKAVQEQDLAKYRGRIH